MSGRTPNAATHPVQLSHLEQVFVSYQPDLDPGLDPDLNPGLDPDPKPESDPRPNPLNQATTWPES